jgi:hypothetical protein
MLVTRKRDLAIEEQTSLSVVAGTLCDRRKPFEATAETV